MSIEQTRRAETRPRRMERVVLPVVLGLALAASGIVAAAGGWRVVRQGLAGKDLNAVYFTDTKRGWIAGDEGFVGYTEDGGRHWERQKLATGDAVNDIYFRNRDDGFLLAGNRIFETQDGGEEWREAARFAAQDFGGAQPELYSVRFGSKKRGWVVGSASRRDKVVDSLVLNTNDGGASWVRQPVAVRTELIHVDFVNDERGWIVGASGTILHTEDGGDTWTPQRSNTDATLYHVDFRNNRIGWAVGERGTVLRTTDGGDAWFPVTVPVRATLLSVQFVNDDEGWIVGRGGTILRTGDGGRTWIRQQSRTTQNLYAFFADKKNNWAVGGDGMVLQYER
ncbi:MAG: WD40/YVTN/BNR-like repeat-containing protein [Pyrinomonadaceae bacterium]